MKTLNKDKTIVCRYVELDAVELVAQVDKQFLLPEFTAMRRWLLQQGSGMFFSDVTFEPNTSEVRATISLYVKENQHFEVFRIFWEKLEEFTGDKYCIDCSVLHRPPTQSKSPATRKGK